MLAHTCLKNSFLLDGVDFSEDRRLRAELERFAPGEVALLFPGPSARPRSLPPGRLFLAVSVISTPIRRRFFGE